VVGALGVVGLVAGAAVLGAAGGTCSDIDSSNPNRIVQNRYDCTDTDQQTAGAGMMIAGGVLVAGAVPLVVFGLRSQKAARSQQARSVRVLVGPQRAALFGTF
jgi:hypothetical protein